MKCRRIRAPSLSTANASGPAGDCISSTYAFTLSPLCFVDLILLIREAGPQVLRGVGAPRPPPFGEGADAPRVARVAKSLDSPPDPEVRGEERVGIAERAHRNIGGSPRPDPTQRQQPPLDLIAVRAGVE